MQQEYNFKIGNEYTVRIKQGKLETKGISKASFEMSKEFIPLELLAIPVEERENFGTINGNDISRKLFFQFFQRYESIPMLLMNLQILDIADITIPAGYFETWAEGAEGEVYLFYLEKR